MRTKDQLKADLREFLVSSRARTTGTGRPNRVRPEPAGTGAAPGASGQCWLQSASSTTTAWNAGTRRGHPASSRPSPTASHLGTVERDHLDQRVAAINTKLDPTRLRLLRRRRTAGRPLLRANLRVPKPLESYQATYS
jgi:hypothetical protein